MIAWFWIRMIGWSQMKISKLLNKNLRSRSVIYCIINPVPPNAVSSGASSATQDGNGQFTCIGQGKEFIRVILAS